MERAVWHIVLVDEADPQLIESYWTNFASGYRNRKDSNDGGFAWNNPDSANSTLAGFLVSDSRISDVEKGAHWEFSPDHGFGACGVVKAGDEDLKLWVLGDYASASSAAEIKSRSQGTSDWMATGIQFPPVDWNPDKQ